MKTNIMGRVYDLVDEYNGRRKRQHANAVLINEDMQLLKNDMNMEQDETVRDKDELCKRLDSLSAPSTAACGPLVLM